MIVAPHILREIQRQSLSVGAALNGQSTLEVAPEALQPVDVLTARPRILTIAVFDQPVALAFRGDPRVAQPVNGTHDRAALDAAPDERQERLRLDIRHDLRPQLPPRQRIPNTGILAVPRPRLVPALRWRWPLSKIWDLRIGDNSVAPPCHHGIKSGDRNGTLSLNEHAPPLYHQWKGQPRSAPHPTAL